MKRGLAKVWKLLPWASAAMLFPDSVCAEQSPNPAQAPPAAELTELSIEELMNIQVTSVAKKPQKLSESAAAVQVVTQEEIRRSGMTTLAELMRLVPGMDVASINANTWAVSARGFNDHFSNKLLVLIDGRTVYSPIFSGAYWDNQDLLLEEIERIEVIRGPGGTLWGANAVNGVINIITKRAQDSQGGLLTGSMGNLEKAGALRYGGQLGDNAHYRVYGKGYDRNGFVDAKGANTHDAWDAGRGGVRLDWAPSHEDTVLLQGEAYQGGSDQNVNTTTWKPPGSKLLSETIHSRGGHGLLRWNHVLSTGSDVTLQAYFDRVEREDINFCQHVDTYDLDFQHRFHWGSRQEIIWGAGYRRVEDLIHGSFSVSFKPDRRNTELFSAFVQDEITLEQNLRLIIGSKLQHNDYTGFEYQPNIRLLWKPAENHSLWAAVSRAVHTPSRAESDFRINVAVIPSRPRGLVSIFGNPNVKSEELLAYELGYRGVLNDTLSVDIAGFYHRYDQLLTTESSSPVLEANPAPKHLLFANRFNNLAQGETCGVEISATWQALPHWRLKTGYAWLGSRVNIDRAKTNPENQFQLHSYLDLPHHLEWDTALYYLDRLSGLNIPGHLRLDLRLGWHPVKEVEISLALQNLLDERHVEFSAQDVIATEVPRSVYAKLSWHF